VVESVLSCVVLIQHAWLLSKAHFPFGEGNIKPNARLIIQLKRVILLANKITLFSCLISLVYGSIFYSILLFLIYIKIRLHFAAVHICPSGPEELQKET